MKSFFSREHVFGKAAVAAFALVIAGSFFAAAFDGALLKNGGLAAVVTAVLVDLANGDRSQNHVGTLTVSPVLVAAAQAKANDMAAKGYFAHVSPDGKDPWYWFQKAGYSFTYAGENLAVDFSDSQNVETAWMNSPLHRANILNGNFSQIGIATAVGYYDGHQTTFVVQEFGTPAAPVASLAVHTLTTTSDPHKIALATTAATTTKSKPKTIAGKATTTTPIAKVATTTAVTTTTTPATVLGEEVSTEPAAPPPVAKPSFWHAVAASPYTALSYVYDAVVILVVIALLIFTGFEIRAHHTRHVITALILITLMCGLYLIAHYFMFTPPTLAVLTR